MASTPERRRITHRAEVRMSEDGNRLEGYAAVFDSESRDMGFTETIAPGAFTRTLRDGDEVVALVEHEPHATSILGRRSADTLTLDQDDTGLHVSLELPDTSTGRDIRELVKRGDITDMSFAFLPYEGGEEWSTDGDGKRSRRLTEVQLYDVSVVATGAYASTTVDIRGVHPMHDNDKMNEMKRLTAEMRGLLDADGMTAEDEQKYDRMEERLAELELEARTAGRRDRLAGSEAELDKPTLQIRNTSAVKDDDFRDSAEYRAAFWASVKGTATMEQRAMSVGTDANGGYAVPTIMEQAIARELDKPTNIRANVTVVQAANDTQIPVESAIGSGEWVAEAGTITPADITFAQKTAKAYKCVASVTSSIELLSDAVVNIEAYFGEVMGRRLAATMETAYATGSGSGQPDGLFDGPQTATTTAVSADVVIDFAHTLAPQYRANAQWVMNDTSLGVIRKLKDSNGQYMWKPGELYSDLRSGNAGTLYGMPVLVNNYAPDNEYVLADLRSAYRIYDRGATTMLMDPYTNAGTGQVTMYAYRRTDGLHVIEEALKLWQPS